MKKQMVLNEQDIKEFHEDTEHLYWITKEWCTRMMKFQNLITRTDF